MLEIPIGLSKFGGFCRFSTLPDWVHKRDPQKSTSARETRFLESSLTFVRLSVWAVCMSLRTQEKIKKANKTLCFAYVWGRPNVIYCYDFKHSPRYHRHNQSCKTLYGLVQGFGPRMGHSSGSPTGNRIDPYHCVLHYRAHTWLTFLKHLIAWFLQTFVQAVYVFGIAGKLLTWLAAFLHNRNHCVAIENGYSGVSQVISGMPQGSVLGPV